MHFQPQQFHITNKENPNISWNAKNSFIQQVSIKNLDYARYYVKKWQKHPMPIGKSDKKTGNYSIQ